MLRKYLALFVVFLFSLLFSVSFPVSAQPGGANSLGGILQKTSDIPGVTCGDASNITANRCCTVADIKSVSGDLIPDFACLTIPVPFAKDPSVCLSDLIKIPTKLVTGILGVDKIVEHGQSVAKDINPCQVGAPEGDPSSSSCTCKEKPVTSKVLCDNYLSNTNEYSSCVSCANNYGVWTGLGCIRTNKVSTFVQDTAFSVGFSIAGAISFLCILYAAIVIQTSRGNPEKIKKARENLRACITGLLLIIFSVFILRFIGVNILRIPGFV